MKKLFGVLVFLVFVSSFASAYYGNDFASGLGYGMEQLIDMVEEMLGPFFSVLLGGDGDLLFERILFLAIILTVVYIVISGIPVFKEKNNKVINWIISISIALLSTRFLVESNLIQAMLLPYSVFGVAISAVLPILIYFTFVQKFDNSATIRKMLWIFYIVVFVGIWGIRYDDVGGLAWMYLMSAIAALVFLLFDGTIRRAIVKQQIKELDVGNRDGFMTKLRRDMGEVENDRRAGYIDENAYKRIRKRLQKQMKIVMKN